MGSPFRIFVNRRCRCCLCNSSTTPLSIIGPLRQRILLSNHNIIAHKILDKICDECINIDLDQNVNIKTLLPSSQNGACSDNMARYIINMESLISTLTSSLSTTDNDIGCQLLINMNHNKMNGIIDELIQNLNRENINILKTIPNLRGAPADILEPRNNIKLQNLFNYDHPSINDALSIKIKLQKFLWDFYFKCKLNKSFMVKSIQQKQNDSTIRRHFHIARVLLYKNWKCGYEGFDHLSESQYMNHCHLFTKTLNQILNYPAILTFDGYEQRMDRYSLFGPNSENADSNDSASDSDIADKGGSSLPSTLPISTPSIPSDTDIADKSNSEIPSPDLDLDIDHELSYHDMIVTTTPEPPSNDYVLEFEQYKKEIPALVQRQRDIWKEVINMKNVRDLECDVNAISFRVRGLESQCTCHHGKRTCSLCYHRSGMLRLLGNLFRNSSMDAIHPETTRYYSTSRNICDQQVSSTDDDDDGYY